MKNAVVKEAFIVATTKLDGLNIEGADFTDTFLRKVTRPPHTAPGRCKAEQARLAQQLQTGMHWGTVAALGRYGVIFDCARRRQESERGY